MCESVPPAQLLAMSKAPPLSRQLQPESLGPSDVRLERVMTLPPVQFLLRIAGARCQTWKELRAAGRRDDRGRGEGPGTINEAVLPRDEGKVRPGSHSGG